MSLTATKFAYDIREVGDLLSVSRTRVFKLINQGHLKTFKDGRRRLVTHKDLEKCVEAMQRASEQGTKGKKVAA